MGRTAYSGRPGGLARLRRLLNLLVVATLRSRAHPLLSRFLLLLTYRGRRTGRTFTIPLLFARDGGDLLLVALHPRGQAWWRNVRDGADVEVLLAGRRLAGHAVLSGGDAAAARAYVRSRPWAAPILRRRGGLFVRVSQLRQ